MRSSLWLLFWRRPQRAADRQARKRAQDAEAGVAAGRAPEGRINRAPDADGRAILQRTCQQCHDMATATTKLPSDDWSAVIAKMMGYGAKLTPADQQKLIEYLNGLTK